MPLSVLVVDDTEVIRQLLATLLRREFGCEVLTAADGLSALKQLAGRRVDLVLLDVGLPYLSGLETLARMRDSADLASIPVVMLTAERQDDTVRAAMGLGIVDYIGKPFDYREQPARLGRALDAIKAKNTEPAAPGDPPGEPPAP